MLIARIG